MKKIIVLLSLLFLLIESSTAQISFSSRYLHSSEYSNSTNTHTGNVNSLLLKGSANVPVYMNISPNRDRVRVWSAFVSGQYLKMYESTTPHPYHIDKILNTYAGVNHYRNLSEKWYLSVIGGLGICTHDTRFSHLSSENIMVFGLATAIYKVNDNLDIGGGIIFTNAFYTPLALPSLYIRWKSDGKYSFELASRTYDIVSSAGMQVNKKLRLSLVVDYNRISTPLKDREDNRYYYSFNYLSTGIRPEIKLSSKITIPIEIGAAFSGSGAYKKRKIASIMDTEESYDFKVCPYISIGFNLGGR